ncbi:MAG: hypothetical protein FWG05_03060, partial [Kiritimatiellaeota bacterium]|nr:hypothetical protein [Kiritimatiellota bacterium]
MKNSILFFAVSLIAVTASAQLPNPRWQTFTNDASTGISSSKRYTHNVNLGVTSPAYVDVNDVRFYSFAGSPGSDSMEGFDGRIYGWSGFSKETHSNYYITTPDTNAVYNLLTTITANSPEIGVMHLHNLTPGAWYEYSMFIRSWAGATRNMQLTFLPDTPNAIYFPYNQDATPAHERLLIFRYQADENGDLHVAYSGATGTKDDSFCLPAFMNEALDLITDATATSVTDCSATLNAEINLTETPTDVIAYWGFEDGEDDENAWDDRAFVFGVHTSMQHVAVSAILPEANTNYVFRFRAVMSHTDAWSDLGSFKTLGAAPSVRALEASPIAGTTATANGVLDWAGTGFANAFVFMSLDGGEPVMLPGVASGAAFDFPLIDLNYTTVYQYSFMASNSVAVSAWTEPVFFTTLGSPFFNAVSAEIAAPGTLALHADIGSCGAGTNLITCWFGTSAGDLAPIASWQGPDTATNITHTVSGLQVGGEFRYAFSIYAEADSTTFWTVWSDTESIMLDGTTTWDTAYGDWHIPASWNYGVPGPGAVANFYYPGATVKALEDLSVNIAVVNAAGAMLFDLGDAALHVS